MKEGTKVKVVYCHTGHEFILGEVVERRAGEYDGEHNSLCFYSEKAGAWYMQPDEYEIVDKSYTIQLMKEIMELLATQGFSKDLRNKIDLAIEQAEYEVRDQ